MRSFVLGLALATLASCTCGGPGVSRTYGELYVVQVGSTGREQLVREATVRGPATFMNTTATFEVALRNVGLEAVSIEAVTKLEGDDTFALDDAVGSSIADGTDAALTVRFAPPQALDATVPELEHRAKFELALGGAREGEDRLVIELVASAVARDCYVPRRVDFGLVPLQQAIVSPIALENGRALDATTTFGAVTGDDASAFFFLDAASPLPVPAGGRVELPVRFSPLEARAYAARFTLQRDAQCPAGEVELVGEGSNEAITWTPARLDFGRLPLGLTATKTVTIVNRSNVGLSLASVLPSGTFSVDPGAPAVVPPRGQVEVPVRCTPLTLGPLAETLTLELGTLPVTPARIALSCIGGGPRVRVDPDPIQFGQVPFNSTGSLVTKRRLIVQNVGTAPPAPGDPANNLVLGRQGALPWFAIVPKNARTRIEEFSLSLRSTWDNTAGLPAIAGHNYAEFELGIAPTSTGLREADLVVYSNDALQPELHIPITAGPRVDDRCILTVTPEGADFGATPRGAVVTRLLTVKNMGDASAPACLVSGIEMAPGSDLAFQVIDPALSSVLVPGGGSKVIRVQAVVPSTANVGDYLRGTLRLTFSGETTPRQLPVDLRVSRCLVVDPPLVDLGLVQENCTSGARPVTLYNVCGVPITLTSLSTPAAPFRVVSSPLGNGPVTLDPAGQLTVSVVMRPTAPGMFADVLQFNTLEAGTTQVEAVALRGRADATGVQRETFTQGNAEVDILLVVDDSCSMADEQNSLATNFAAFISAASQGNGNWQIGVTTTDVFSVRGELKRSATNPPVLKPTTPNVETLFAEKVRVGVSGSGSEQPFAAMTMAVTEPNRSGPNAGFLRPAAALAVVIVTDATEQSPNSVGSYLATLRGAKQNRPELVSVSVVGPFMPTSSTCTTEGAVDLGRFSAAISQTNGVQSDICTQNWAMDLESISRNLFGNRRTFELVGQARSASDVDVFVNGVQRTSGWSYSSATNAVTFSTPPAPGATIEIVYRTACF